MARDVDPDSDLDWTFDWKSNTNQGVGTDWLEAGEGIASAELTVDDPDGLASIHDQALAGSNTQVTFWLKPNGSTANITVHCKITTDNTPPRVDERSQVFNSADR